MTADRPTPHTLRDYFLGEWRLVRLIRDCRAGQSYRLDGAARFSATDPQGQEALYSETGSFEAGGIQLQTERRYHYRWLANGTAEVRFADGRPFHDLAPQDGLCRVTHLCGADLYRGRYRLLGPDRWRLAWHVTGPRKALVLSAEYRRRIGP